MPVVTVVEIHVITDQKDAGTPELYDEIERLKARIAAIANMTFTVKDHEIALAM